jgi:hypothetical protein
MTAAWRELTGHQRRAGAAAIALALTLLLPWYRTSYPEVVGGRLLAAHDNRSAFGVFSWVEAAVLLVAAAVVYLLWARAQRRAFHLPGGDGWAVTIAGGWALFLLVWRLFDKPAVERGTIGVQWGLFVAMGAAAVVMAAGQRMRAARSPEPPNPAEDLDWTQPPRSTRRSRSGAPGATPADPSAVTRALRHRPPAWEGEPPEPLSRAPRPGDRPAPPQRPAAPQRRRPDRSEHATRPLWEDGDTGDDGPPRLF